MIEEEELQFLLYWKNYVLWKMSRSKILFGGSSLKMELAVCKTFRVSITFFISGFQWWNQQL